ncbi:hypothetical protein D3C84_1192580 [compost metagenome]
MNGVANRPYSIGPSTRTSAIARLDARARAKAVRLNTFISRSLFGMARAYDRSMTA